MNKPVFTRTTLLLDIRKVRRLRKFLQAPSNSEAVRRVIDQRLAMDADLHSSDATQPRKVALERLPWERAI